MHLSRYPYASVKKPPIGGSVGRHQLKGNAEQGWKVKHALRRVFPLVDSLGHRRCAPTRAVGDYFALVVLMTHGTLWRVRVPNRRKKLGHGRDVGQLPIGMNGSFRGLAQEQLASLRQWRAVWLDPQFSGAWDSSACAKGGLLICWGYVCQSPLHPRVHGCTPVKLCVFSKAACGVWLYACGSEASRSASGCAQSCLHENGLWCEREVRLRDPLHVADVHHFGAVVIANYCQ